MVNRTLIFDPITFKGGSKIATSDALNVCRTESNEFIVVTVDPNYWQETEFFAKHQVTTEKIIAISWLMKQHYGIRYWLNQFYLMLFVCKALLLHRNISKIVGASGPGIDMPIYLANLLFKCQIIQFIHGNVGCSRSIGYCLTQANNVFYLPSTRDSLKTALSCYLAGKTSINDCAAMAESYLKSLDFQLFVNGIPASRWPSRCQHSVPIGFWAASLLKWKGLDTLICAVKIAEKSKPTALNICFIRPVDTCLPTSQAPVLLRHTKWYEDPSNLDQIRSQSNIFISTSCNEPFGLSILEALAAGMCVVIPRDGAFWDTQLTHKENCIKYQAGDEQALAQALLTAMSNHRLLEQCSHNAVRIAAHYQAEHSYHKFAQTINGELITSVVSVCD